MNITLTINGNDYKPITLDTEQHLHERPGTWNATVPACNESLWSDMHIDVGGTRVMTGYFISKRTGRDSVRISGADTFIKVNDYFLDEEVITTAGSSVADYIDYIMGLVGVDYTYPVSSGSQGVEPDVQIGPGSAATALEQILKYSGLYTWVDVNGTVHFGQISSDVQHIIPDTYISREQEEGDEWTRHTVKVYGLGAIRAAAYGSLLGDPINRIAAIECPFITTEEDAQTVADLAVDLYNSHDDIRTIEVEGTGIYAIPETVVDDGLEVPVTSIYHHLSRSGLTTTLMLNERSPRSIGETSGSLYPAFVFPPTTGLGLAASIIKIDREESPVQYRAQYCPNVFDGGETFSNNTAGLPNDTGAYTTSILSRLCCDPWESKRMYISCDGEAYKNNDITSGSWSVIVQDADVMALFSSAESSITEIYHSWMHEDTLYMVSRIGGGHYLDTSGSFGVMKYDDDEGVLSDLCTIVYEIDNRSEGELNNTHKIIGESTTHVYLRVCESRDLGGTGNAAYVTNNCFIWWVLYKIHKTTGVATVLYDGEDDAGFSDDYRGWGQFLRGIAPEWIPRGLFNLDAHEIWGARYAEIAGSGPYTYSSYTCRSRDGGYNWTDMRDSGIYSWTVYNPYSPYHHIGNWPNVPRRVICGDNDNIIILLQQKKYYQDSVWTDFGGEFGGDTTLYVMDCGTLSSAILVCGDDVDTGLAEHNFWYTIDLGENWSSKGGFDPGDIQDSELVFNGLYTL